MKYYETLSKRIPLEGTINTRSLEGYISDDGRKIKKNRVFRTDALISVTERDKNYLRDVMHARYDIDLRDYNEITNNPEMMIEGIKYVHCPIQESLNEDLPHYPHPDFHIDDKRINGTVEYFFSLDKEGDISIAFEKIYRGFISKRYGVEHYKILLNILRENKEGSILFHCMDGKDRCGLGVALFLTILGVDKEAIMYDYLKTNEYTKEKADARVNCLKNHCHMTDQKVLNSIAIAAGVRANFLEAAFDEIDKRYGGMDKFIRDDLGFTSSMIEEMKDNYLE